MNHRKVLEACFTTEQEASVLAIPIYKILQGAKNRWFTQTEIQAALSFTPDEYKEAINLAIVNLYERGFLTYDPRMEHFKYRMRVVH
jgi:hypothetical protein